MSDWTIWLDLNLLFIDLYDFVLQGKYIGFQIVDLEDGILQLKEDLIQERTQARQEKKKLKEAVV